MVQNPSQKKIICITRDLIVTLFVQRKFERWVIFKKSYFCLHRVWMGQKKHKSCLDNILMEPKLTMEVKIENNWAILIAFNSKLTVKFPLSSK